MRLEYRNAKQGPRSSGVRLPDGRRVRPGDVFEASEDIGKVLLALGDGAYFVDVTPRPPVEEEEINIQKPTTRKRRSYQKRASSDPNGQRE